MSSIEFSACLQPDKTLRQAVLLSGVALGVAGIVLILTLPIGVPGVMLSTIGWLGVCGWELRSIRCGYANCQRLRISADGAIQLLESDGDWYAARLLAGSVLLRSVGWIRIVDSRGNRFAEPARGNRRLDKDWRRLHVIWRHIGAVPGSC